MTRRQFNSDYIGLGYSPSIDGWRAITVSSVIAYHAYSTFLQSGLIGVDIFFVISGFVVSASVLSRKFETPGQLLVFFFARRILRIAPALLVCVLITTAATIAFIPIAYLSDTILNTALASLFGMSNFILYGAADNYFAPRAELNPFTHTWSLAVEEQFYLLFPLVTTALLFACPSHWSRRGTVLVWSTLTAASVVVAIYQSLDDPVAAFYLTPARFWELGTGVVVYLMLPRILRTASGFSGRGVTALGAAGLVGIAASLIFTKSLAAPYPFPAVAPAVVATAALLIAVVARPNGPIARWLARPMIVYVGRISYSLYLWHWPVFVLMRWTVGFSSPQTIVTGVLLSFLLAAASYHWVELPIRSVPWRRTRRLAVIGTGFACVGFAACAVYWATQHQRVLSASVTSDRYIWYPEGPTQGISRKCGLDADSRGGPEITINFVPTNCTALGSRPTIFVVGDSHAGALIRVFIDAGVSQGITTHLFSRPGCGVLTLRNSNKSVGEECAGYARRVFGQIAHSAKSGDIVFLPSLRMPRLMFADGTLNPERGTDADPASVASALSEAEELLELFQDSGVRVVFSAPLPIFRTNPYRCSDWFNSGNPGCGIDGMTRVEIESLRSRVMASLERLSKRFSFVSTWDPIQVLCDTQTCSTRRDGKPLFFDGDHLTGWANDILFPSFMAYVESLAQPVATESGRGNVRRSAE